MARGNKYTCATCGTEFTYCPKCATTEPNYDAERYCSKKHAEIFEILSKNGCHLETAEKTLEALKNYDLTGLTKDIQEHINSLKPTVKVESKKEVETVQKSFRTQE